MINSPVEYQKMSEVESSHWWYQCLHQQVLTSIQKNFNHKEIQIIDAGCGTGGLSLFLKEKGYTNIKGFDFSTDAVQFCTQKNLNVQSGNLKEISKIYPPQSADLIIINDVLYFFNKEEREAIYSQVDEILKPGGVLITNLPALESFRGTHDILVGNFGNRFSIEDSQDFTRNTKLELKNYRYWPFLLSPIVFTIRWLQRMRLKANPNQEFHSDIDLPNKIINLILKLITMMELKVFNKTPFASSLFLTFIKK
tara:strand:+ start:105243 stop:106001 length:759 start_codon:yes stop_codon:yes gene_type:complete